MERNNGREKTTHRIIEKMREQIEKRHGKRPGMDAEAMARIASSRTKENEWTYARDAELDEAFEMLEGK